MVEKLDMQKSTTRPSACSVRENELKKSIKDLNVRLETIKTLEENIGSKSWTVLSAIFFSNILSQARETKE